MEDDSGQGEEDAAPTAWATDEVKEEEEEVKDHYDDLEELEPQPSTPPEDGTDDLGDDLIMTPNVPAGGDEELDSDMFVEDDLPDNDEAAEPADNYVADTNDNYVSIESSTDPVNDAELNELLGEEVSASPSSAQVEPLSPVLSVADEFLDEAPEAAPAEAATAGGSDDEDLFGESDDEDKAAETAPVEVQEAVETTEAKSDGDVLEDELFGDSELLEDSELLGDSELLEGEEPVGGKLLTHKGDDEVPEGEDGYVFDAPEDTTKPQIRERVTPSGNTIDNPLSLVSNAMAKPSTDAELSVLRLPHVIEMVDDGFDAETFEQPKNKDVQASVRWRVAYDNTGAAFKESNTRLVKWSDGNWSLFVGKEHFEIQTTDFARSGNQFLFARDKQVQDVHSSKDYGKTKDEAIYLCHGALQSRMSVRANMRTQEALNRSIALKYARKDKAKRVTPGAHLVKRFGGKRKRSGTGAAELARERKRVRQKNARKKDKATPMTAGFLEQGQNMSSDDEGEQEYDPNQSGRNYDQVEQASAALLAAQQEDPLSDDEMPDHRPPRRRNTAIVDNSDDSS